MNRRTFLGTGLLTSLLPTGLPAFQGALRPGKLKITGVEIWKLEGHRETLSGVDKQYQVNPLHIYDELRPKPYADAIEPKKTTSALSALYLKIRTDAGLDGLYGPIDKEAAIIVEQQLKTFLIGKDPLAGEALWDQMYRSNRHSRRGLFLMAISAVDNAIWDLRGRYFNTPVYRLLGGPTRRTVEAYASCLGYSLELDKIRTRSVEFRDAGFRYEKWFLAYGPGDGLPGLKKNIEIVKTLREALGDEVEIMFDVFQGWSLDYAISWAKQVEQYRPRWIEEAFPADKIETFAQLRRSTSIPVASGEHFYGRMEVHDYLKAGAVSVVQSDPEWCGGVTELVKVCTIASLFDAQVIPHGHSLHAALHVVASQSPAVCPLAEYLVTKMQSYYHFEKHQPKPVRGRFELSDRPGFGIEWDDAKVEKRTLTQWY
jgi:L-alanine-DL-glutamate epimerase-like enolase superfamily enzyme